MFYKIIKLICHIIKLQWQIFKKVKYSFMWFDKIFALEMFWQSRVRFINIYTLNCKSQEKKWLVILTMHWALLKLKWNNFMRNNLSIICYSLVGHDIRLSIERPEFKSRQFNNGIHIEFVQTSMTNLKITHFFRDLKKSPH
jgi:hypothetical protein